MKYLVAISSLFAVMCIALPIAAQSNQRFVVVVHPENPVTWAAADDVSQMFLTKKKHWRDGVEVLPVDLKSDSRVRKTFSEAIHKKSVTKVESFLHQQIFSGRAKPPLVVASDAEVIAFVSQNRGAVGYVSNGSSLQGVRVLDIATSPERIKEVAPRYTAAARKMNLRGEVVLEVDIDTEGNVSDVTTVKELGMGLTKSAKDAVMKWKYKPATLGGEPVETTIMVTIRF